MNVFAVTGGVACGKSEVAERLKDLLKAPFFSSDECVASLLEEIPIQRKILGLLKGYSECSVTSFSKSLVRKHAFENSEFREKLEALIHPLVYQRMMEFLGEGSDRSAFMLVEVPLLYEVEFPLQRDLDLVVAASRDTQVERLIHDRGLELETANQMLEAQLPIDEKIRRADVVVWNDGSIEALKSQIEHLARRCFS